MLAGWVGFNLRYSIARTKMTYRHRAGFNWVPEEYLYLQLSSQGFAIGLKLPVPCSMSLFALSLMLLGMPLQQHLLCELVLKSISC